MFTSPSQFLAPARRRLPFRPMLEALEQRVNPDVFDDIWQFNEGQAQFNEITPVNEEPPPRKDAAATAANGKLLVFGGRDGSGNTFDDVWSFDPAARTWTELPQSGTKPGGLFNHSAVALANGQVAVFGGNLTGGSANIPTFLYNPMTGQWNIGDTSPFGPTTGQAAVPVGGNFLVTFGGTNPGGTKNNDLRRYNADTHQWTAVGRTTSTVPPARTDHWAFVFPSGTEIVTGSGTGSELQDVWSFDLDTAAWTQRADMPQAVTQAAAAGFTDAGGDQQLLVYGGRRDGQFVGDAFLYDVAANQWQTLNLGAVNPGPRSGHAMVTIDNVVFLFGGDGPDDAPAPSPAPPATTQPAPVQRRVNDVAAELLGNKLRLTGDEFGNNLRLALGKNKVTVSGLGGTTVNGQTGPVVFEGVRRVQALLGAGNDEVRLRGSGLSGPVVLNGGRGNDRYVIGTTDSTIRVIDPDGRDRIGFSIATAGIVLDLGLNRGQWQAVGGGGNRLSILGAIEDATGSPFDDVIRGTDGANDLDGFGGDDDIDGLDGRDTLR